MFNTLIPLSRELWPMIDRAICSRMTKPVELATRYTASASAKKTPVYDSDSADCDVLIGMPLCSTI